MKKKKKKKKNLTTEEREIERETQSTGGLSATPSKFKGCRFILSIN